MLIYPHLNPIAFHLGSWPVYWYGLMYLVGFLSGWGLLRWRLRHTPSKFTADELSDIVFFAALGAILGGRIGYMLFYGWADLVQSPLLLFQTWRGGMSFHGGFIGVLIALAICAHRQKKPWLALTDLIAPVVPIGLGAGRIGNFINGELWGRVTDVPWGMVFPNVDALSRHPSQLYEFLFEGVILFVFLWFYASRPRPLGAISGFFALGYGLFRMLLECVREPDRQIGFIGGIFTEGQLLSFPLLFLGIGLIMRAYRRYPITVK